MKSLVTILLFTVAALIDPIRISSQTPLEATPVGHWVAEHPSQTGIGSWWNFRSDGTLTMHIGAVVNSPITRSGDTFTSPAPTVGGAPITVTYHVDADTLHIQSPNIPEQTFSRIGPAVSATDPLLGKWKPLPPATPSTDPNVAAQQKDNGQRHAGLLRR